MSEPPGTTSAGVVVGTSLFCAFATFKKPQHAQAKSASTAPSNTTFLGLVIDLGIVPKEKAPSRYRDEASSCDYSRDTLTAPGPLGPSTISNETVSPSLSSSNVTPERSLEWKKRSF